MPRGMVTSSIDWTEETFARLCQFWDEGHSTAEIGRRLGVSKNAVCGKARRSGLPERESPIKAPKKPLNFDFGAIHAQRTSGVTWPVIAKALDHDHKALARWYAYHCKQRGVTPAGNPSGIGRRHIPAAPPRVVYAPAVRVPVVRAPVVRAPASVVVLGLYARTCQFPLWAHNERPPFPARMCEAPSIRGSFCSAHARVCYLPAREAAA